MKKRDIMICTHFKQGFVHICFTLGLKCSLNLWISGKLAALNLSQNSTWACNLICVDHIVHICNIFDTDFSPYFTILSILGYTYVWEQVFSNMNYMKTRCSSALILNLPFVAISMYVCMKYGGALQWCSKTEIRLKSENSII